MGFWGCAGAVPARGETSSALPSKVPSAKLGSCFSKEAPGGLCSASLPGPGALGGGKEMLFVHPNPPKNRKPHCVAAHGGPQACGTAGTPTFRAPKTGLSQGNALWGRSAPFPAAFFLFPLCPPPQGRSVGRGQDPLAGAVGRGPLCNRTPLRGPAPGMPAPRGGCQGLTKGERL